MIVRPATPDDLPALLALAHSAGTGLTTLPADASPVTRLLRKCAVIRSQNYLCLIRKSPEMDLVSAR